MSRAAPILKIAAGEFKLQTRRFAFWLFIVLFVAMAVFYFTRYVSVSAGEDSLTQGVKLARNSAYSLAMMMGLVSLIFAHFTAAMSIDPVLRDRRIGLLPMILSSPLSEGDYILGKFLGVAAVSLLAPAAFLATAAVAQLVPNSSIGLLPPSALPFVVAFVEFAAPPSVLVAAFAFALAVRTANAKLVYALVTVYWVGYLTIANMIESIEKRWTTYLDPTGVFWLAEVMGKGKTNVEQNAFGWMVDGGFAINRIVVVALAAALVAYVARGFGRWEALAAGGRAARARGRSRAARPDTRAGDAAAPAAPAPAGSALRPLPAGLRLSTGALRQFGRVAGAELRLLSHERALIFLVPLLVLILMTSIETTTGPFESEAIPTTSHVVRATYGILLLFLFGTTTFFAGESAFRERDANVADMLNTCPVPESAVVFGKAAANVIVSLILIAVAGVALSIYQVANGGGAVEMRPFVAIYGAGLLPTVLLMTSIALLLGSIVNNKPAAYGILLVLGGVLVWAYTRGHRHWLYNLPAVGLSNYSDIVGLGPLGPVFLTQRAYVVAIALLLLLAAAGLAPRTAGGAGGARGLATWRRRGVLAPAAVALAAALALGVRIHTWVEGGALGALATERLQARYERVVKPWLEGRPEPEIAGVDLDLDLYPERNAFRVAGAMRLLNNHDAPLDAVHLTVAPRLIARGEITLGGRPPDAFEDAVATFRLAEPLAPGAELPLAFRWEGRVPDGPPRHSAGLETWIQPGATFLHSFDSAALAWLPTIGYQASLEIGSERTRRKQKLGKRESLPDDDGEGQTPGMMRQSWAFPYRARIRVPDGERVLSAGNLVAERDAGGGRREFEFASDGPIYFFPVMAGRWLERRDGRSAIHFAAQHAQNADKMLDALTRSRAYFSEAFSPFPYQELRIAEFPRHGAFAMGYPTLIPFSESIGFLTRDPKRLPNLNFYVTAHEVAHQWWGTVVWPAHAKGAPVLTEGLANYATLLVAEAAEGDAKRRRLFRQFEDRYLRQRDPNEERPLVLIDGDRRGDNAVMYSRGGVVFYMLDRVLGRERMLAAMKEYVRRYSFQEDHPTMTDFVALFRELYPETAPFLAQYIEGKAIPNPAFTSAKSESLPDGRWRVAFEIANRGEGDIDLVIEAHEGKRADEEKREREGEAARRDAAAVATGGAGAVEPAAAHAEAGAARAGVGRAARAVARVAGAAPVAGEILCDFRPDEIEMDPDGAVLLQERLKGRRAL